MFIMQNLCLYKALNWYLFQNRARENLIFLWMAQTESSDRVECVILC